MPGKSRRARLLRVRRHLADEPAHDFSSIDRERSTIQRLSIFAETDGFFEQ